MRRDPAPISTRIAAIVNQNTGERRRQDDMSGVVVGRSAGGGAQRLSLAVSVSGLGRQVVPAAPGSSISTRLESRSSSVNMSSGLASLSLASPSSPSSSSPLSSSPLSATGHGSSSSPTKLTMNKLRKRVTEARSRWSWHGLHRRWWQQRSVNANRNKKYLKPGDDILTSCSRRLQRINQLIARITKKHQILRYDRIAEKYLHWENHLREQMMIRRWGTKKNVELDQERRADLVRVECLQRRRDALVRMMSCKR